MKSSVIDQTGEPAQEPLDSAPLAPRKPLAIDLYCGLGGWAEGFLAEGYDVVGFDIERRPYPGRLVLQDVLTIHGSQFRNAAVIVGSSPCQEFSYRAMPWKRAKALPPPVLGISLFQAQFRIQREASEAAGRYIPMVVENVCGAQKWVGRAAWHYGSYYLWGDVPALMPFTRSAFKPVDHANIRDGHSHTRHLTNQREHEGLKVPGIKLRDVGFNVAAARRIDPSEKPSDFKQTTEMKRQHIGYSRVAAAAQIAKIPFDLAVHIARTFYPVEPVRKRMSLAVGSAPPPSIVQQKGGA